MSTAENTSSIAAGAIMDQEDAVTRWQKIDHLLVTWGERLNPILVKETRQALKSRQFLIAFSLLLAASWIWTVVGTASAGAAIYYRPSGRELFMGYYAILAVALGLVVPYMAFRSLVAESDENTYDLLSITTLTPRQIIGGKLGSSAVQVGVYLAAVGPCLAFTYLLRGIDIFTIALVLTYTVLGSLGLSVVGLLIASVARAKFVQVILSVLIVIGLLTASGFGIGMTSLLFFEPFGFVNDPGVVLGCMFAGTLYATTFAIILLAAASRITFESENRSTALRIACLVQFICLIGWMIFPWSEVGDRVELTGGFLGMSAMLWYLWGMFMTTESPELSRRVTRQMPSRTIYRFLFFWFLPGPGTGYVFALANLMAAALLAILIFVWESMSETIPLNTLGLRQAVDPWDFLSIIFMAVIVWSYLAIFLGIGKLLITLLRKATVMNIAVGIGTHLVLLGTAITVPFLIQFNLMDDTSADYSLLHITNPFYTWGEAMYYWESMEMDMGSLAVILLAGAIFVLFLNMHGVVAEIRRLRSAMPSRVVEDEVEIEEAAEPGYHSPWDK